MASERQERSKDIFLAAQDLPRAQRADFVKRACGSDASLEIEVGKLLDAMDDPTLSQLNAVQPWMSERGPSALQYINKNIGRYLIKSVIGGGGMGYVFLADQMTREGDGSFGKFREVAVKVMNDSLASDDAARRFRDERQILGRLEHQNIAKIFDADIVEFEGREIAMFAMEFVPGGHDIVEYSKSNRLSVNERLRLFAELCDAVHYAHMQGVVHRDIKPTNVLVGPQGRVKLIDFGIALITQPELIGDRTGATREGQIPGTLQYMAPEQVRGERDNIDSKTDIYALGQLLFELLTEHRPYDVGSLPLSEAIRVICDDPGTDARTYVSSLPEELITILRRARRKTRELRYDSAAQMAEDLRRFLSGMPLLRHNDGPLTQLRYRARAFSRRHPLVARLAVATSVAAVVQGLGAALIFNATSASQVFEDFVALRWLPPAMVQRFEAPIEHVRIVRLPSRQSQDWVEVAASAGLDGVRAEQMPTYRIVYGELIRRISRGGARVVGLNFMIAGDGQAQDRADSSPLVDAIKDAINADPPCFVWISNGDWSLTPAPMRKPALSSSLYSAPARVGPASVTNVWKGWRWGVDLAVQHDGMPYPMPSLLAGMAASYWKPASEPQLEFDKADSRIRVSYRSLDDGTGIDRWLPGEDHIYARGFMDGSREGFLPEWAVPLLVPSQSAAIEREDSIEGSQGSRHEDAVTGLSRNDQVAVAWIAPPSELTLDAATLDASSVLGDVHDSQLSEWFGGRAVLVDFPETDPNSTVRFANRREVWKAHVLASTLDSILRTGGVRAPWTTWFETTAGALFGLLIGWCFMSDWRMRLLAYTAMFAGSLVCALVAYHVALFCMNPLVGLIALVTVGEVTARMPRLGRLAGVTG